MKKVIKGIVEHGNKIGRKLGFPTANIFVEENSDLEDGVYAAQVIVEGDSELRQAMVNIGVRPTIGAGERVAEAYIFDYNKDIYGLEIEIILLYHIRSEQKFHDIESLARQIEKDKQETLKYFKKCI